MAWIVVFACDLACLEYYTKYTNQLLTLNEAIGLGSMLQSDGVCWFEDPLFSDSICELKKLSQKIKVPICEGENFYSDKINY